MVINSFDPLHCDPITVHNAFMSKVRVLVDAQVNEVDLDTHKPTGIEIVEKRARFFIGREVTDLSRLSSADETETQIELHSQDYEEAECASLRFILGGGSRGTTTYAYSVYRLHQSYWTPRFSLSELANYLVAMPFLRSV